MSKTNEVWKSAPGFEGLYEVSNLGRVRSVEREVVQTVKIPGKVLSVCYKTRKGRKGSAAVGLRREGTNHQVSVPRLVLLAFVGKPPDDTTRVKRKENDAENNSLENLSW